MLARTITRALDIAGRAPPHNTDAEAATISAIITHEPALADVRDAGLLPEHMYDQRHRFMLEGAYELADIGSPVDVQTLFAWLKQRERAIPAGGIEYIARIIDASPAVAHVDAHARIIVDLARRRQFIDALSFAQGEAWTHTGSTDAMIADSLAHLDHAAEDQGPQLTQAYHAVETRMRELALQWTGQRAATGIPSHLPGLQSLLGGYRLGATSVLAGPTSGGKSSAALQEVLGLSGCSHNDEVIGAVVISLEMDCSENVDRALAIESRVPDKLIQSGALSDEQHDAVFAASDRISKKPIWFETSEVDLHGIRSAWRKADREFRKHGEGRRVRFVLVDFLGLVRLDDAERHDIALSNLSRGLKMFAMAENVHVMELCQFSRAAAARDAWDEPQLSDLKDSSGIEQNANQVIMVHRVDGAADATDYAAFVVRKNRKGEKGRVKVRFNGESYRFEAPSETDLARWESARASGGSRRRRRQA